MKKAVSAFLFSSFGALLALWGWNHFVSKPQYIYVQSEPPAPITQANYASDAVLALPDFTVAAEQTLNSVVHIKTLTRTQPQYIDPFHQFFYGHRGIPQRIQSGSGSGVILDRRGYIVTNNHVIDGAEDIEVVMNDKRNLKAQLIGKDPATDLAVLKIDADDLSPIVVGNSDRLKVGEWVLAIGNPFNLSSTVTAGIVSAKARNIDVIRDHFKIESFIQTDAAVNPGNSGGALVNVQGELIGINTAIASNTGSYAGYAFAIPSNLAYKIAHDIIEFGTPQRGLLGVNARDLTGEIARTRNIPFNRGVVIEGLQTGAAAAIAGILPGDILTGIQGAEVRSVSEMQEQLGRYRPGDVVQIKIWREGKEWQLPVTLMNSMGNTSLLSRKDEIFKGLAADFEPLNSSEMQRLGLRNGLRIKSLRKGRLSALGIRAGFIITEINGKAIYSEEDLMEAIDASKGFYVGGVYPTGEKVFYTQR
jgi:serine protease Do